MQSWIDDLKPQCGPLTGAAKQYLSLHGIERDPPRGLDALRHLLTVLRTRNAEVALADDDAQQLRKLEERERPFVEMAGGFLALVLADRLQGARHVELAGDHGLQVGRYGFFDPFAGVAAALQADDVAQGLIAAVAMAEAEAESRSGETRVVDELSRQLATEAPELEVARRFRMRVFLGGGPQDIEVDIAPLVEATRGESDATVARAVGKIVASLSGTTAPALPLHEVRGRILPRLVGKAFLDRLGHAHAAEQLALCELSEGVFIGFILDHGQRARFIRTAELGAWGVDLSMLRDLAVQNLAARSARARLMRLDEVGGRFVVASSGDGLDAARALLPGLHGVLRAELGEDIVVAVPHRDLLIACAAGDAGAVQRLSARAADESRRAPHPVSDRVFELRADGSGIAGADGARPRPAR